MHDSFERILKLNNILFLLNEFLSNDELKFAKSVKRWCENMVMLPAVACAAFGGVADFWGQIIINNSRAYMMWLINCI
jgi:hypothetical protein